MEILLQSPIWFFPLCLLCGAAFSVLLYYREKRTELSQRLKKGLAVLRFVTISLIAFLLMAPLIKITQTTREKPLIILAQDNSASPVMSADSVYYRQGYLASLQQLARELGDDFEVSTYTFGDQVREGLDVNYQEAETDLSGFIEEIRIRYANRNVGAVVMASDGLYNRGRNPVYAAENLPFTIYTVAMGDTSIRKDLILRDVQYNKVSYLGNRFPLEVVILGQKCTGASPTLKVSRNGQVLFTKVLKIDAADYLETVPLTLVANAAGMQHYRVEVSTVAGELSTVNNIQDIYVEVLDARQKILILGSAPHPDMSALKQSLETNTSYDVETALLRDFNKAAEDYQLVILHQLPAKNQPLPAVLQRMIGTRVPVLFLLGMNSDIVAFNNQKTGLLLMQGQQRWDEAQAVINTGFSLFTLSEETQRLMADAPPLSCPFGEYRLTPLMTPLFYQKIGKVATNRPLMVFSQGSEVRTGIVCGEGIWKWRLFDYLQSGQHAAFDELSGRIIQFLSVKADKGRFRVSARNLYAANEAVEFSAELYNESYEMVNGPEVSMQLTDQRGKKFEYAFNRTPSAYHLNAGILPVGDYKWLARVKSGSSWLEQRGAFPVQSVNKESLQLVADHELLSALASTHGGHMIQPQQLNSLADSLRARDDIKTITDTRQRFSDFINLFWVLMLIIVLLTVEWVLRKRGGAY